jgi:hypothetical protein
LRERDQTLFPFVPDYLAWCLQGPETQSIDLTLSYYYSITSGSLVGLINLGTVWQGSGSTLHMRHGVFLANIDTLPFFNTFRPFAPRYASFLPSPNQYTAQLASNVTKRCKQDYP